MSFESPVLRELLVYKLNIVKAMIPILGMPMVKSRYSIPQKACVGNSENLTMSVRIYVQAFMRHDCIKSTHI